MRLGVVICAVLAVLFVAWGTFRQYDGKSDGPAAPQVEAFADCLSAAGVSKADATSETYYGSEGRIFVPGGEVFVFATQQAAEGGVAQIEADNASPQMIGVNVVAVPMPDQGEPFPVTESSNCAYGG